VAWKVAAVADQLRICAAFASGTVYSTTAEPLVTCRICTWSGRTAEPPILKYVETLFLNQVRSASPKSAAELKPVKRALKTVVLAAAVTVVELDVVLVVVLVLVLVPVPVVEVEVVVVVVVVVVVEVDVVSRHCPLHGQSMRYSLYTSVPVYVVSAVAATEHPL